VISSSVRASGVRVAVAVEADPLCIADRVSMLRCVGCVFGEQDPVGTLSDSFLLKIRPGAWSGFELCMVSMTA
jgi:hypothetical protein